MTSSFFSPHKKLSESVKSAHNNAEARVYMHIHGTFIHRSAFTACVADLVVARVFFRSLLYVTCCFRSIDCASSRGKFAKCEHFFREEEEEKISIFSKRKGYKHEAVPRSDGSE